jgi:hypothetical protein
VTTPPCLGLKPATMWDLNRRQYERAENTVGIMVNDDESCDEKLKTFFQSVLAFLIARFKGKLPLKRIQQLAKEVLESLGRDPQLGGWEDALPVTVEQAKRKGQLCQTVRIFAHVAELKDPQIVTLNLAAEVEAGPRGPEAANDTDAGDEKRDDTEEDDEDDDGEDEPEPDVVPVKEETTCFCLRDAEDNAMWSLEVLGSELLTKLQEARRAGLPVEFLGMPIAVPARLDKKRLDAAFGADRKDIVLHLLDVRPSTSALNMLAASRDERRTAEEHRAGLATAGQAPLVYMTETLITGLGIAGTDDFPLLRDLLEFTVLQSLAVGRITHASARLHLLLVGPPGQGKKLVGVAARMLNPFCSELSASKVSPAGLVGASFYGSGGWTSKPGLLPRAAHGVALLQDAHGWSDAVVRQVGPVLQEVIEDGVVRSAVAGGVERAAPVGLIIDANRTSQLDARVEQRAEAAILRLRPLLSRLDVIAEIPEDPERAWDVARQMYGRLRVHREGSTEPPWARPLRLLVATLRDRHPEVDLSQVTRAMEGVHANLHEDNRDVLKLIVQAGDIPTRVAISFGRLVAASARAHDRSVASDADVEVALKYLNLKLRYLAMHAAKPMSERPDVQDARQDWVSRYAGATVSATDVAVEYQAQTGVEVSPRTIRRDFIALGAKRVGKDKWLLPPTDPGGPPGETM